MVEVFKWIWNGVKMGYLQSKWIYYKRKARITEWKIWDLGNKTRETKDLNNRYTNEIGSWITASEKQNE